MMDSYKHKSKHMDYINAESSIDEQTVCSTEFIIYCRCSFDTRIEIVLFYF
jgi:hypothetical protein